MNKITCRIVLSLCAIDPKKCWNWFVGSRHSQSLRPSVKINPRTMSFVDNSLVTYRLNWFSNCFAFAAAAKSWNLEAPLCQNTVFVCTDEQLPKMDIKLAQIIIHFSLPSTWKQFSFRFSAMSDYFEDLVINNVCTQKISYSTLSNCLTTISDTKPSSFLFSGAVGRKRQPTTTETYRLHACARLHRYQ